MFGDFDSYNPHDLIAGDFPLKTETITLAKGQNLKRGSLLGRLKDSGKYVLSRKLDDAGKEIADGSEKPLRILGENVDAAAGDKLTVAYKTGYFFLTGVTIHESHKQEEIRLDLEARSIFFEE
jgi:hypothetical protein